MRQIYVCEERGIGIDKIINTLEVFQLPAPDFIAEEIFMRVILYSPIGLEQMSKSDKLRLLYTLLFKICYQSRINKKVKRK